MARSGLGRARLVARWRSSRRQRETSRRLRDPPSNFESFRLPVNPCESSHQGPRVDAAAGTFRLQKAAGAAAAEPTSPALPVVGGQPLSPPPPPQKKSLLQWLRRSGASDSAARRRRAARCQEQLKFNLFIFFFLEKRGNWTAGAWPRARSGEPAAQPCRQRAAPKDGATLTLRRPPPGFWKHGMNFPDFGKRGWVSRILESGDEFPGLRKAGWISGDLALPRSPHRALVTHSAVGRLRNLADDVLLSGATGARTLGRHGYWGAEVSPFPAARGDGRAAPAPLPPAGDWDPESPAAAPCTTTSLRARARAGTSQRLLKPSSALNPALH